MMSNCFGCFDPCRPYPCCSDNCLCMQPPCCCPHYCCAQEDNGPTLVIHKIVLDACGNQSCTPKTFHIRVTGPSYPNGEIFDLRAGSCLDLDEPLVISGLQPGEYCIEELFEKPYEYTATITGPVHGNCVTICDGCAPVVVTIVNRKRLCRLCRGFGYGCQCGCHCGCSCGCQCGCGCSHRTC